MSKGSGGVTRGDRRKNARRERLWGLLPRDGAVVGIDLGEDKQVLAVADHEVRVLARKTVRVKASGLGAAVDGRWRRPSPLALRSARRPRVTGTPAAPQHPLLRAPAPQQQQ